MKTFDERAFGVLGMAIDSIDKRLKEQAQICSEKHIEMDKLMADCNDEFEFLEDDTLSYLHLYSKSFEIVSGLIELVRSDLELIGETLNEFYYDN